MYIVLSDIKKEDVRNYSRHKTRRTRYFIRHNLLRMRYGDPNPSPVFVVLVLSPGRAQIFGGVVLFKCSTTGLGDKRAQGFAAYCLGVFYLIRPFGVVCARSCKVKN